MRGPSGRDQRFSQLAAERMMLNFDHVCCTFIRQRDLVSFIRAGVARSPLSTAQLHKHQRQGEGTNAPITISLHCFDIKQPELRRERFGGDK